MSTALKERTLSLVAADRASARAAAPTAQHAISTGTRGSELYQLLTGGQGGVGAVSVTPDTIMRVSTVYACVALLGGAMSSMPLQFFRRDASGPTLVDSDLWWLFNESPNPLWTSASAWDYAIQSILLSGDGFQRIDRASPMSSTIVGFTPLDPLGVEVLRHEKRNYYRFQDEDGVTRVLDQDDVLHFPGVGFDGRRSITPIRAALQTCGGIALSADNYAASFFANGARPDFAITTDKNLSQESAEILRQTWYDKHQGNGKNHLPAVLTNGMTVKQVTMNAEDAQLLETRKFSVEDICRVMGVPPFMVGHTEKTTSFGSGVEQIGLGFVKYTMARHLQRLEQEINRKVWPRSRTMYAKFDTAGLERGDVKTRNDAYRIAVGRAGEPGWLTINEIRRAEGRPAVAGGDTLSTGEASNANPKP